MVSVREARARLSDLVAWLCNLDGSTERRAILVLRRGRPWAALVPAVRARLDAVFFLNRRAALSKDTPRYSYRELDEARRDFLGVLKDVAGGAAEGAVIEPEERWIGGPALVAVVSPNAIVQELLERRLRADIERLLGLTVFQIPARPKLVRQERRIAAVGRKT